MDCDRKSWCVFYAFLSIEHSAERQLRPLADGAPKASKPSTFNRAFSRKAIETLATPFGEDGRDDRLSIEHSAERQLRPQKVPCPDADLSVVFQSSIQPKGN